MNFLKKWLLTNRRKQDYFEVIEEEPLQQIENERIVEEERLQPDIVRMTAQEANKKGFFFRINGRNCKILSYKGDDTCIAIPAYINGKPVRIIGKNVFAKSNIQSVLLPDTVRIIRENAFCGTMIEEVVLPIDIERIEDGAFENCTRLERVVFRQQRKKQSWKIMDVNGAAFRGTPYIESSMFVILDDVLLRINPQHTHEVIAIPDGVVVIGKEVFKSNWNVSQIEVPFSVKLIRECAFAKVYHLKNVFVRRKPYEELRIQKEAFGNFKWRGPNAFCMDLLRSEVVNEWGDGIGWKRFRQFEFINPNYWNSLANEREIYFPVCKSNSCNKVLNAMRICYCNNNSPGFYFALPVKEYFAIMMGCNDLKEQIEMAICLLLNVQGEYKEKALAFIKEHINKAVFYAVRDNRIHNIRLYQQQGLLQEHNGLRLRSCRKWIEQYNNPATQYLKNCIEGRSIEKVD